ncbi:MAG: histidine phosphatase family protein [Flavobacteriaceae bacterium]|nr:histidine phosphatase family protein [Flavobacteriaceae bacterium]
MKKISLFLMLCLILACGSNEKPEGYVNFDAPDGVDEYKPTTYYFIRHAEKDVNVEENPQLTFKGIKRANYWGEFFKDKELNSFYTTKFTRNYQTLIPVLHHYKGEPTVYEPKADSLFSKEFWQNTYGKNVVVVGHNNTTPAFVNEILRQEKYDIIEDGVNGNLYRVDIDEKGFIQDTLLNYEKFELPEEILKELEYLNEASEVDSQKLQEVS